MASTVKMCVFCGDRPVSKNKEHVIPLWLLKHVGIADDMVQMGFHLKTGKPRQFVYKSFTFPACEDCNTKFSSLEAGVKPALIGLLAGGAIDSDQFSTLLDWFDNVRVGLWLGFYFLNGNLGGITPKFHIKSRLATQDRMLHLVRVDKNPKELSFRGCDSLSFHFTPSCFSMIINNLCFYNISSPFLFSRRLGFPYTTERYLREDGLEDAVLVPGTLRQMGPLLRRPFAFSGTGLYQPIFKSVVGTPLTAYYANDYVRRNSLSIDEGMGRVLIQDESLNISSYPDQPSTSWIPKRAYERQAMNPKISIDTLEWQLAIEGEMASTRKLPAEKQKWWRDTLRETRKSSRWFIRVMEQNARTGNYT
jgi:hypothetical protein